MGAESLKPANTPTGAVFLSYASQDAEAAQRICDALRAADIEVWLDQTELRGGDAWDRQIRERIHDCRLFIALISAHTEARDEGYFRREWKLAVDRTHDMLEKRAFLLPVAIDATPERGAAVPEKFHEVQWTRLPGGETPPEFVARIKRLLSPEPPASARLPAGAASGSSSIPRTTGRPSPWRRALPVSVAVLVVAALAYLLINKPWISKPSVPVATSSATSSPALPAAFTPPPHSIAVLPFVNLSGDKNQEYFSDGLTEEILNSLARINELQVAARTSAFSFKGKDTDIGTIAHKLNVASILEGSVRRSGHTIRVTAQLNNAVTGFHVWSQTYDRDLGDVLKLQAEIATAVASALKVALLGDEAARIEVGGTRNPAALDAYLRATQTFWGGFSPDAPETAVAGYTEALRLDSDYALAYAARALAIAAKVAFVDTTTSAVRADLDRMQADAAKAIALAPNLSEGFLARAVVYEQLLEFKEASENYERALALAPGNARALRDYGGFAVSTGHSDLGLAAVRRAVVLDPLNSTSHGFLGAALVDLRRYPEALAAFEQAEALLPAANYGPYVWQIGTAYYLLGDYASARAKCEQGRDNFNNQLCLALAYDKLGRHADAEAALKKAQTTMRDLGSYQYAAIYAQWGNRPKALEWLDIAMHRRVPALYNLKTNPLMDPLRQEPRFRVIERELKFPD